MKTNTKEISHSLKMVDKGIRQVMQNKYPVTGNSIWSLLEKRREVLLESQNRIKSFNKDFMINFSL